MSSSTASSSEAPAARAARVKNRRQAIAIALNEAGASKYESERENRANYARTKRKEARGETAQQETEGKSRVGARGGRESSPDMGASNAKARRGRARDDGPSKAELYKRAQARHIKGRSHMTKRELEKAVR
jgi:hypothetical protein